MKWLGNKKLDKTKMRSKILNIVFKYIILAKIFSFDRLLLFQLNAIIHVLLRGLCKLTFNRLNGWVLNFSVMQKHG